MHARIAATASALALAWSACALPAASATTPPAPTPGATTPAPAPTPAPTSTIGGAGLLRPGILTARRAGIPKPPELKAGAYLVADLRDGRVILAKNAHVQSRPASTLKTLTALTLAPVLSPTTTVTATPEDAAIDGTKVGVLPGQGYTVRQLLTGLMLTSGNDAANALARANGGMAVTARQMTERAHALGALDTFAKNTSGLDATGQLTSAYDLALLGRAAVNDPDVAPYLTIKTAEFPGKRTAGPKSRRERFQITNHNRLLWNYDGTIGVKNGFTRAAGQTYIGAARRGDQAYVLTYLSGQGVGWRDTAAVLDWAFAYGQRTRAVGELVDPASFDRTKTPPVERVEPEATAGPTATATAPTSPLESGQGRLALAAGAAVVLAAGGVALARLRRR